MPGRNRRILRRQRETRTEIKMIGIRGVNGARANLKIALRHLVQEFCTVGLISGRSGLKWEVVEVCGMSIPGVVQGINAAGIFRFEKVDGLFPTGGCGSKSEVHRKHRLRTAPIRSPAQFVVAEISDQVGIMRSGRAHSLSNLLGLSLELGIVNIHRNALLPVCARLSGDIQNNRVGNSAFPDIGIRPRADGIKAPCSQARKGGHSPAIFIGINPGDVLLVRIDLSAANAIRRVGDLIDADGNHGVTGRINKPPDARTLLYPKVLSLTVQSGDKAKEHGQRPEMSKPNSHGARSSDWGAEVKPSYPAHHKSFQSGRWRREACEPGRPSVRTR